MNRRDLRRVAMIQDPAGPKIARDPARGSFDSFFEGRVVKPGLRNRRRRFDDLIDDGIRERCLTGAGAAGDDDVEPGRNCASDQGLLLAHHAGAHVILKRAGREARRRMVNAGLATTGGKSPSK